MGTQMGERTGSLEQLERSLDTERGRLFKVANVICKAAKRWERIVPAYNKRFNRCCSLSEAVSKEKYRLAAAEAARTIQTNV